VGAGGGTEVSIGSCPSTVEEPTCIMAMTMMMTMMTMMMCAFDKFS